MRRTATFPACHERRVLVSSVATIGAGGRTMYIVANENTLLSRSVLKCLDALVQMLCQAELSLARQPV